MGLLDNASKDTDLPIGDHIGILADARINAKKDTGALSLVLDWKATKGVAKGLSRSEFFKLTGATNQNFAFMLQRYEGAFLIDENHVKAAAKDADTPGKLGEVLVKLALTKVGRPVRISVRKNSAGYTNIVGGESGVVPVLTTEDDQEDRQPVSEAPGAAQDDPWATTSTSGTSPADLINSL